MSERSQVTDRVMKYIEQTPGMWGVKVHGNAVQGAGIPDILACVHGRFVAVECKRPAGGRLSKLQSHELWKIRKAGGIAIQCRSLDEFIEITERLMERGNATV